MTDSDKVETVITIDQDSDEAVDALITAVSRHLKSSMSNSKTMSFSFKSDETGKIIMNSNVVPSEKVSTETLETPPIVIDEDEPFELEQLQKAEQEHAEVREKYNAMQVMLNQQANRLFKICSDPKYAMELDQYDENDFKLCPTEYISIDPVAIKAKFGLPMIAPHNLGVEAGVYLFSDIADPQILDETANLFIVYDTFSNGHLVWDCADELLLGIMRFNETDSEAFGRFVAWFNSELGV